MKTAIPLSHLLRPLEPANKQAAATRGNPSTAESTSYRATPACDNSGLRRLDPNQVRNSVGQGEAEARLLFAKAQMAQTPLSSLLAQANIDSVKATRLLD